MKLVLNAIACIALCAGAMPAAAVNKCTGADGKVSFQDSPCASGKGGSIEVKPASGSGRQAQPTAAAASPQVEAVPAKPQTEAQRIEALVEASKKERRRNDLEQGIVPNALGQIDRHKTACDTELKTLQTKKASAANNLAGATWEASISSEMLAVTNRCNARTTELRADHQAVLNECRSLGGCKNF